MGEGHVFAGRGASISNLDMSGNLFWNIRGWKTHGWIDELVGCHFRNNNARFDNWEGKNPQSGPAVVYKAERARGNSFQVKRRAEVSIDQSTANVIDALADDGEEKVGRRHLGGSASGPTLNLEAQNTARIKNATRGDLALDDGTNTASRKPGWAVFDGSAWQ